jgi:integrase
MPKLNFTVSKLESLKPGTERIEYWDKSFPGLVVRVTPGGDKIFSLLYRIGGHQRRYTLGAFPFVVSLADARERARDALKLVRNGIDPAKEQKRREEAEVKRLLGGSTFAELTKQFLEQHAKNLRSYYEINRSFEKYLLPRFGKAKVGELKRADVRVYLENMAKTKPVMANRCLSYLRTMFKWALSRDLVESNPISAISRPGAERPCDRVLSEDEIRAIWTALDSEQPIIAATFRLRLVTAQRGGEVHAMRWKDIDGEWWTIPSEFSKNRLSHRVPLSPEALAIIEDVRRLTDEEDAKAKRQRSEWVFPKPRDRAEHVYAVQQVAERVRAASKVSYRAHDLRRTSASMMAAMGVPRLVIGKILNHVESGVTRVYDRYSYDREKREALNAWGARLSSIIGWS